MTTVERPRIKRFTAPPPIISAECSVCGTDIDPHILDCWHCGVSWTHAESDGEFRGRNKDQCPSEIRKPNEGPLRCVLSKNHPEQHIGVPIHEDGSQDDTADNTQMDSWRDAEVEKYPNSKVVERDGRQHLIGDPEPPGVGMVRDRDRDRWTRDGSVWRTDSGDPLAWVELLRMWGPVIEMTAEAVTS